MSIVASLGTAWAAVRAAKTAILTGLCVAAVCLPTGYCAGKDHAEDAAEAARANANTKAVEKNSAALENAATQRRQDDAAVAKIEKDLTDAVEKLPDAMPSVRRVARACAQLRAQGTDTSRLPECGGSAR